MRFYRILNSLMNLTVSVILLIMGIYAGFALWDNRQVTDEAENIQQEILQWKPEVQEDPEHPGQTAVSFEELKTINSDVCGWITMDGTNIDFPVVQGDSNISYLNTDFYGDYALAGSVFLDSRNGNTFEDSYNLLYGHHMSGGNMFGDLDCYKSEDFFNANRTGRLITPDGVYELQVYAVLLVPVSDPVLLDPLLCMKDPRGTTDHIRENALFFRPEDQTEKTLALSTCAAEFQDARTIVLTGMKTWQGGDQNEA